MKIKKVKGNRVYVQMPQPPNSNLELSEEVKQSLMEAQVKQMEKLPVYAVGDTVEGVSVGDVVYVDPRQLGGSPKIELDKNTTVVIVSSFDIAHIWEK